MAPRELSYVVVWPTQVMYGLPNYPLLWVTTLSVMGIEEATPKKITQEICKEAEEKKAQQERVEQDDLMPQCLSNTVCDQCSRRMGDDPFSIVNLALPTEREKDKHVRLEGRPPDKHEGDRDQMHQFLT